MKADENSSAFFFAESAAPHGSVWSRISPRHNQRNPLLLKLSDLILCHAIVCHNHINFRSWQKHSARMLSNLGAVHHHDTSIRMIQKSHLGIDRLKVQITQSMLKIKCVCRYKHDIVMKAGDRTAGIGSLCRVLGQIYRAASQKQL